MALKHSGRNGCRTLTRSKHLQACSAGGGRAFIQVLRLGNFWSVGHVEHLSAGPLCRRPRWRAFFHCGSRQPPSSSGRSLLTGSTSFVKPFQRVLRFIVESQGNVQLPAELIFQLSNLEDTIVCCLSFCSDQDIGTLLRLASVSIFAVELLLSSDPIDALAYDTQASTWLQEVPGNFRLFARGWGLCVPGPFRRDSSVISRWDRRSVRIGTLAIERASVGARVR